MHATPFPNALNPAPTVGADHPLARWWKPWARSNTGAPSGPHATGGLASPERKSGALISEEDAFLQRLRQAGL